MLDLSIAGQAEELSSAGVSVSDFGNPFFVQIAKDVVPKVAAIAAPDAKIKIVSNSYDLATQIKQINDLIAGGVQMTVLNAADSEGVLPVLEKARQVWRDEFFIVGVDGASSTAAVQIL